MNAPTYFRVLVVGTLVLWASLAASAAAQPPPDPIATYPGTLTVPEQQLTKAEFGTPTNPPLPADFFGPGSDPFDGIITFSGDPLDPDALGNTSLLLQRDFHPVDPADPIGTIGSVEAEIVELSLTSYPHNPILVTYGGINPEAWYVRVELSGVNPPPGSLTATKTHANGGTFDCVLPVQPRFIFTRVGDGQEVVWDTGLEGIAPVTQVMLTAPWVHAVDPGLAVLAPSDGLFVPLVEETIPGDPGSQCKGRVLAVEANGSFDHDLIPPTWFPPPDPFVVEENCGLEGTEITFGTGPVAPIPADFFGPGSDPFEGQVCLRGEPLGPTEWGEYGDACTLILRMGDPFDRCDLALPDLHVVPTEIVALDLRSIDPITVTYVGGGSPELWDLKVDLSTAYPQGTGGSRLVCTKSHANGGSITTLTDLYPNLRYTFTRLSDMFQVVFDPPSEVPLTVQTDAHWVHTATAGLGIMAPSDGRFVPGVQEQIPGDPLSQVPVKTVAGAVDGAFRLTLWPTPMAPVAVDDRPARRGGVLAVPNPFNLASEIQFELARSGRVGLRIYDVRGSLVRTLIDGDLMQGPHTKRWGGIDDGGRRVPAGVYFAVLRVEGATRTTKITVVD